MQTERAGGLGLLIALVLLAGIVRVATHSPDAVPAPSACGVSARGPAASDAEADLVSRRPPGFGAGTFFAPLALSQVGLSPAGVSEFGLLGAEGAALFVGTAQTLVIFRFPAAAEATSGAAYLATPGTGSTALTITGTPLVRGIVTRRGVTLAATCGRYLVQLDDPSRDQQQAVADLRTLLPAVD